MHIHYCSKPLPLFFPLTSQFTIRGMHFFLLGTNTEQNSHPITKYAMATNALLTPAAHTESQQHKGSNHGTYRSRLNAFRTWDHAHSSYSCYQFPQESEGNFLFLPTVIILLAPNDTMNIQLTIVSAQCFMHDILGTPQSTTLKF